MAGKAGAAGPGGAKGGKDGAKEAPARKQYQGPDQELAAMLERDIIDTAIKVTCVRMQLQLQQSHVRADTAVTKNAIGKGPAVLLWRWRKPG